MLRTLTEDLVCPLAEEEVAERASELSSKVVELAEYQEGCRQTRKDLKEGEEVRNREITRLAQCVRTKTEARPVEVYEQASPARRIIEIIRSDTGELVRTRPMTTEEINDCRQVKLPGTEPDDDDGEGGKKRSRPETH